MLDPDFLLDADSRERLATRFGTGVDSWFAALPGLVERCCQRWHLELDEALSGSTSGVFTGRQHGGGGVVLKLTPEQAIAEEEALARCSPACAVQPATTSDGCRRSRIAWSSFSRASPAC